MPLISKTSRIKPTNITVIDNIYSNDIPIISKPTRITPTTATVIDNIYIYIYIYIYIAMIYPLSVNLLE